MSENKEETSLDRLLSKTDLIVSKPGGSTVPAKREGEPTTLSPELINSEGLGWIGKFRAERLRVRKQLDALEVTWQAQVDTISEQTKAEVEQSRTYWRAQAALVSEKIRSHAQSVLRDVDLGRQKSRDEAIAAAVENGNTQMKKIAESDLPEKLKLEALTRMTANMMSTIERIMEDLVARQHGL